MKINCHDILFYNHTQIKQVIVITLRQFFNFYLNKNRGEIKVGENGIFDIISFFSWCIFREYFSLLNNFYFFYFKSFADGREFYKKNLRKLFKPLTKPFLIYYSLHVCGNIAQYVSGYMVRIIILSRIRKEMNDVYIHLAKILLKNFVYSILLQIIIN